MVNLAHLEKVSIIPLSRCGGAVRAIIILSVCNYVEYTLSVDTGPDDKPPSSGELGVESSSGADTPDPIDPFLD